MQYPHGSHLSKKGGSTLWSQQIVAGRSQALSMKFHVTPRFPHEEGITKEKKGEAWDRNPGEQLQGGERRVVKRRHLDKRR